jgi:hypothetical protein
MTFLVLTASPNTLVKHPAWLTVAVSYRDLMILIGVGVGRWFCPGLRISPIMSSKITTVLQITSVIVIVTANAMALVEWPVGWLRPPIEVLSFVTAFFCLVSAVGYYRNGVWMLQTEGEEPPRVDSGLAQTGEATA